MSNDPNPALPSTKDDTNDDDTDHRDEDAAEILSDLLQNQASVSTDSGSGTQVGEAQQAALQQLIRQEPSAVLNQPSVRALLDAMGGDSRGDAAGEAGKKHVFWDTQVRQ